MIIENKQKILDIMDFYLIGNIENIEDNSTFDSLGIDSLDKLEIIYEIEKQFKIKIESSKEISNMKTFQDLIELVNNKIIKS